MNSKVKTISIATLSAAVILTPVIVVPIVISAQQNKPNSEILAQEKEKINNIINNNPIQWDEVILLNGVKDNELSNISNSNLKFDETKSHPIVQNYLFEINQDDIVIPKMEEYNSGKTYRKLLELNDFYLISKENQNIKIKFSELDSYNNKPIKIDNSDLQQLSFSKEEILNFVKDKKINDLFKINRETYTQDWTLDAEEFWKKDWLSANLNVNVNLFTYLGLGNYGIDISKFIDGIDTSDTSSVHVSFDNSFISFEYDVPDLGSIELEFGNNSDFQFLSTEQKTAVESAKVTYKDESDLSTFFEARDGSTIDPSTIIAEDFVGGVKDGTYNFSLSYTKPNFSYKLESIQVKDGSDNTAISFSYLFKDDNKTIWTFSNKEIDGFQSTTPPLVPPFFK